VRNGRLGMQAGHLAAVAFGFGALERFEDVRHGQAQCVWRPDDKRGSSTPDTRFNCMKVVGPAMPSGISPCARWKADTRVFSAAS
jgi:hypothetical protein